VRLKFSHLEAYGWRAVYAMEAAFMIPVWIGAARLLPQGVPSTNLSYPRLLASLWPLMRDNSPIRQSMMVQALLWACFNAFWVNLAALLAHGPWQLGSAWAGGFGIIGAAGALAASLGGRASDRLGSRKVIGASIGSSNASPVAKPSRAEPATRSTVVTSTPMSEAISGRIGWVQ
jgi:predicted MFS family arabinose efflux permease